MRLLHVHTLKLESFDGLHPHYVAASHRWLSSWENCFRDVQTQTNLDSLGYNKVQQFAAFVRNNVAGVDWLWIDSCCINMDSSQELQEAIISMYKWYEGAALCVAFLSDVTGSRGSTSQDLLAEVRESEWFTRGWTLQELLAPRVVLFVSQNWVVIGHKAQYSNKGMPMLSSLGPRLNTLVADLTRIPETVIDQPELRKELSVDEKLQWVATRVTKRPEDRVYCILGLLDVSMPLLYGEGETAAWRRLMREIGQTNINDATRAESSSTSVNPYHVPFSLNRIPLTDYFVPRDLETRQLETYFRSSKSSAQRLEFIVGGMGGMGKSRLCANFVREQKDRFSAVFWLDASSRDAVRQSLGVVATRLRDRQHVETLTGSQTQENLDGDVDYVLRWLSISENTEWLLVFDNLDRDWEALPKDHQAYNYRDFLPSNDHGNVLITTRLVSLRRPMATIHLRDVTEGFARRIVQIQAGRELEDVDVLVNRLGRLPLALAQAGAYLFSNTMNVSEYLHFYDTAWSRLMDHQAKSPSQEYPRSIAATFQISYDQVEKVCVEAARLLDLWTFFHFGDVWQELISKSSLRTWPKSTPPWLQNLAIDPFSFQSALSVLSRYSLITMANENSQKSIHPVIHAWSSHRVLSGDSVQGLFETAVGVVIGSIRSESAMTKMSTKWRLAPHARALLKRAQEIDASPVGVNLCQTDFSAVAYYLTALESLDEQFDLVQDQFSGVDDITRAMDLSISKMLQQGEIQ